MEEAKKRVEAWWQGEVIDRAAIMITAPINENSTAKRHTQKKKNLSQKDYEDYFLNPERVIKRKEIEMKNTYWAGEALPYMHPTQGMVAILANYLGCPIRFVDKNTTWSYSIIDNWDDTFDLSFNHNNKWWQKSKKLLKESARRAQGKYLIIIPDLNGPSEILSRLRGEDKLAIDTLENKDKIKKSLKKINKAWYRYWQACHGIVHQYLGGYLSIMRIWSEIQATDLQSDFSIMISSETFDELILPFIEQQTEWIQRTIYHLDGPGATRHLDSLLALDKLDGIQWVPGAGAPPASEWISLLKKIQSAGKLIYISVHKKEVKKILKELNPEGLLMTTRCNSRKEADQLLKSVKKWT